MNFFNDKISFRQLVAILVLEIFSTSFLALPKVLYPYAKQDSWLIVIVSGLIAYLSISLHLYIYKKLGAKTYKNFLEESFGSLSNIIIVVFILKNLLFISFELTYFLKLIEDILLPNVSKTLILIFLLCSTYYFSKKGIETRGRLAEFLILPLFIFFMLFFIIASISADFTNIFPIFTPKSTREYTDSIYYGLMAFSGFEYIFILVPFLKKKDKLHKASIYVAMVTTIFISLTTLLTIVVFNKQILVENYPVIMILNSIALPFDFIERQDSLVFSLWIIGSFFTVSAGFFYSSLLYKDINKKTKYIDEILVLVVFVLTLSLDQFFDEKKVGYFIFSLNLVFLIFLPLLSSFVYMIKSVFKKTLKEDSYENL